MEGTKLYTDELIYLPLVKEALDGWWGFLGRSESAISDQVWLLGSTPSVVFELLVFPATPALQHDFTIQLGSSTFAPSSSVRNLGVIFDDQLTFKDHIPQTARSCRFALHNIRKIRPFVMEHAAQLLIQALVRVFWEGDECCRFSGVVGTCCNSFRVGEFNSWIVFFLSFY